MKSIALPAGELVPALGIGTWRYGEDPAKRADEIATLRLALDLGVTLIDTAEMYGEGRSEELIGEAIADRRSEAFLVSKVYPHNATRKGAIAACERSLGRLRTDVLDLYLLHWRANVPLEETMEAFTELQEAGKIRFYGVSNLDLGDMQELWEQPGGQDVQTNQLLYNLSRRGIEWDLLPWLRKRKVPVMAYSPIEQARLVEESQADRFRPPPRDDARPGGPCLAFGPGRHHRHSQNQPPRPPPRKRRRPRASARRRAARRAGPPLPATHRARHAGDALRFSELQLPRTCTI